LAEPLVVDVDALWDLFFVGLLDIYVDQVSDVAADSLLSLFVDGCFNQEVFRKLPIVLEHRVTEILLEECEHLVPILPAFGKLELSDAQEKFTELGEANDVVAFELGELDEVVLFEVVEYFRDFGGFECE